MPGKSALVPFAGNLVEGPRRWSAEELSALQERLYELLCDADVGPGARVALALVGHAPFLAAAWAARARGAVVVLLSAQRTGATRDAERVGEALIDAEPDVVLVDRAHAEGLAKALQASGAAVYALDDGRASLLRPRDRNARTAHPEEAALLCYTSGTERAPKGVLLARHTLDFLRETGVALNDWSPADTYLSSLPLTHMFGFNHATTALHTGATVVACPDLAFMGEVKRAVALHRVTVASMAPRLLSMLLGVSDDWFASLTHLRRIWLGGAQLAPRDIELALAKVPGLQVGNIYGLSEALRSTILWPDDVPRRLPSIGRALPGIEIELRDESGRPLRDAEARGLAWIRGPNVMLGYWKKPEETAAVLKDGWFCTNDMLRRSADGYLWLEGRSREILNCGGEKLSPEVLERHIATGCSLAEVAVLGSDTGGDVDEVVAVIVGRASLESVRAACAGHVSSAFLPRRVVEVDRLPWKAEGKLDRAALRRQIGLTKGGPA